jgi:hypothetical protein
MTGIFSILFHCESRVFFLLEILECHMYGEERNAYKVLVGKAEGKGQLGSLSEDEKMLLNYIIIILKNRIGRHGLDESRSGLGQVLCWWEDVSESLGPIKCKEFTA